MKISLAALGFFNSLGFWFKEFAFGFSPAIFLVPICLLELLYRTKFELPKGRAFSWFIIFACFAILSTVVNFDTLNDYQFQNIVFYLIVIIMTWNIVKVNLGILNYYKAYLFGTMIVTAITFLSYIFSINLQPILGFELFDVGNGLLVLNGCELNPGTFAYHLITILPFTYYYFVTSNGVPRFIYCLALIVLTMTLLLTYSRGAWIGIVVAVSLVIIVSNKIRQMNQFRSIVLFFSIVLILISIYLFANIGEAPNLIVNKSISEDVRAYVLYNSIDLIKENPLFGVGSGNFIVEFPGNDQIYAHTVTSGHNTFISVATEYGIPAALALYIMFTVLLTGMPKFDFQFNVDRDIYRTLWVSTAAMIFDGLFHDNYINSGLWISIGFLMALASKSQKNL